MTDEESKKYYDKMIEALEKQIRDADEEPKYSSIENSTDIDEQLEPNSTIERIRVSRNHKSRSENSSKTSKLNDLKTKYPHAYSSFNQYRDRDPIKQYHKLVSTKDLKIAEFVLKWEHEHGKRIHKYMAWELLTEFKQNNSVSDEFLKRINQKYEE
jgi:hypothetical protein